MDNRTVFIIDPDEQVRKMITITLEQRLGVCVKSSSEADLFLTSIRRKTGCDLLITSISSIDMDGFALLRKVKKMLPPLPIIVLSDVPDIKRAIEAMKLGAFDFFVKPFDQKGFINAVECALSSTTHISMSNMESLTKTEQAILKLILLSKTTKEIARIRSRSTRTIEDQRQSIMLKLGARDIIDLVKIVGFVRLPRCFDE